MESRVPCVIGFHPANFQLPTHPSVIDLESGKGQTDRRQSSTLNAPPYGGGIIIMAVLTHSTRSRLTNFACDWTGRTVSVSVSMHLGQVSVFLYFLPRDAIRKRGLSFRLVSVRPS